MAALHIRNACWVTPEGLRPNTDLIMRDGLVQYVGPSRAVSGDEKAIDADGLYLSAGFVDIHVHGGGGSDFADGTVEDIVNAARTHMQHGTTTLMPTLVACDLEELKGALACIDEARRLPNVPRLLGLHIEGPYVAANMCGALDPAFLRDPDPAEYTHWLREMPGLRRVTLAPELPGGQDFIRAVVASGRLVSLGHSDAKYQDVIAAIENGATAVTHLYSCTSTIRRESGFRIPGLLEAAQILPLTVELIADGCHLPPELLRLVAKIKPVSEIVLVTDAMRAAGQDVPTTTLGSRGAGQTVIIEDGVAKLQDRTSFAGSIATSDRLLRTMASVAGIPLPDVIAMMTRNPARTVGIEGVAGDLRAGSPADAVLFTDKYEMQSVFSQGEVVKQ